jgi:hypothetical protein
MSRIPLSDEYDPDDDDSLNVFGCNLEPLNFNEDQRAIPHGWIKSETSTEPMPDMTKEQAACWMRRWYG